MALARQAAELGVLTLRGFARLLEERIASAREEPDLPSTRPGDPDTVRILSIHKAKGLEAPVVALLRHRRQRRLARPTPCRSGRRARSPSASARLPAPGLGRALRQRDETKAWAEARRLLYVACTRARDLLVIPKPAARRRVGAFWKELVDRAARGRRRRRAHRGCGDACAARDPGDASDLRALALAEGGDAVAARWRSERAALARARPSGR